MVLVENPLHNGLVETLQTTLKTTSSTRDGAENGFTEDKSIFNANQKGAGPKIINDTENALIKIITYESNVTKVRVCFKCEIYF